MSASAVIDGLITMLESASVYGACGAADHYAILETSSASCAVVSYRKSISIPALYGDPPTFDDSWTILIEGFCKDINDPGGTIKQTACSIDKIMDMLKDDDTIQGTVDGITEIRGERRPGEAVSTGGQRWTTFSIEVDATEMG